MDCTFRSGTLPGFRSETVFHKHPLVLRDPPRRFNVKFSLLCAWFLSIILHNVTEHLVRHQTWSRLSEAATTALTVQERRTPSKAQTARYLAIGHGLGLVLRLCRHPSTAMLHACRGSRSFGNRSATEETEHTNKVCQSANQQPVKISTPVVCLRSKNYARNPSGLGIWQHCDC